MIKDVQTELVESAVESNSTVNWQKLTIDDFQQCGGEAIISSCETSSFITVAISLFEAAKQAQHREEVKSHAILWLLGELCSVVFQPKESDAPFRSGWLPPNNRAVLTPRKFQQKTSYQFEFTQPERLFLQTILPSVSDHRLAARIADVLQLMGGPQRLELAKIAIDQYTKEPLDKPNHYFSFDYWWRAAVISKQFGQALSSQKQHLEQALWDTFQNSKSSPYDLMTSIGRLALNVGLLEKHHSKMAEILFDEGVALGNELGRFHLKVACDFYKQFKDPEAENRCLAAIGDSLKAEAFSFTEAEQPSFMKANSFFQDALSAYRKVKTEYREAFDVTQSIEEVRSQITQTGKTMLQEFGLIKGAEVDISDLIAHSEAHVSGKLHPKLALAYFAGLYRGANIRRFRSDARKKANAYLPTSMFQHSIDSFDGRQTGVIPGYCSDSPWNDQSCQRITYIMQESFHAKIQSFVKSGIMPALDIVMQEHEISLPLLIELCESSWVVPSDRVTLTAKALMLGFEKRFDEAIYLIAPQVEHGIRTLLKEAGALTTTIQNGTETENGLGTLLESEEAKRIFTSSALFEMKAIFTDPTGPNLRNAVAHGLLSDEGSYSIYTVYAWFFALRAVVTGACPKLIDAHCLSSFVNAVPEDNFLPTD